MICAATMHHSQIKRFFLISIALTLLTLFPTFQSMAENRIPEQEKFVLRAGAYQVRKMSTELNYGSTTGAVGVNISFEDTLDLPDGVDVQKLSGYYRINRNQRIDFSYYDIIRSSYVTLPVAIDIGGVTFGPGDVQSDFASKILTALWSYSFVNDKDFEFGLGGGLYISNKNVNINAVTGPPATVSGSGTVPLPVFSFRGDWKITRKWRMGVEQQILIVDVGSLEGSLSDFEIRIEHQTFKNVGFGAALNYFASAANITTNGRDAEIISRYEGLYVYLKGAL